MKTPDNCGFCRFCTVRHLSSEPAVCRHPERAIDAYSPIVHENEPPAWCPLRPDAVPYDGSINFSEDHPSHPKWKGRYAEWMEALRP